MNIKSTHTEDKPVSAKNLFSTTEGKVVALQIKGGGLLAEHVTQNPALLICISGNVVYKDETGIIKNIISGDLVNIKTNVKHWVEGIQDSQLLLIK